MTDDFLHIAYGTPPLELLKLREDAIQCSPLIPGSRSLESCAKGSVASAVLYGPPGTLERRYLLVLALEALAVDAPLTALAPKNKGGNRIAAELSSFGCDVSEESRQHFRICTTTRPAVLHSVAEAIKEGGTQRHLDHGLLTQPGIFSWNRIDAGSALLLKHLPALAGRGADLGCGLGVLGLAVLQSPKISALTLVDIDRRAVDVARHNITDPRAQFLWADIRLEVPSLANLDFVVMNPPFHDGGVEDRSLGQLFIERAATVLRRGGICWLVANRHLPYEELLAHKFTRTTLVAQVDGFKIYAAEK